MKNELNGWQRTGIGWAVLLFFVIVIVDVYSTYTSLDEAYRSKLSYCRLVPAFKECPSNITAWYDAAISDYWKHSFLSDVLSDAAIAVFSWVVVLAIAGIIRSIKRSFARANRAEQR